MPLRHRVLCGFAVGLLLATAACGAELSPAPSAEGTCGRTLPFPASGTAERSNGFEHDLFDLHNAERTSRGIPALTYDTSLADQGAAYASALGRAGELGHSCTFVTGAPPPTLAAENVSDSPAQSTPQSVNGLYMGSPSHAANILDARLAFVGIGAVVLGDRTVVTVVRFSSTDPGGAHTP